MRKIRIFIYFLLTISTQSLIYDLPFDNKNTTNFQSLFDLVNPSDFLHNYESWFNEKQLTTPSTTTEQTFSTQNYENYTTLSEFLSTLRPPLLVGGGQTQTVRGPQSLTLFMNFQNDGTTSLQVLSENNLNWFDLGNCRHGQIFHAATQLCVDLFCIDGYILTSQGCLPDTRFNLTNPNKEPIKKPPPKMEIEVTIAIILCTYVKGFNDTFYCNKTEAMSEYKSPSFINEIHANISLFLGVDFERVQNFKILNHFVANHTIIKKIENVNEEVIMIDNNQTHRITEFSITEQIEYLKIRFLLADRLEFLNKSIDLTNRETITLFYFMVMHSLDKTFLNITGDRQAYLSDVNVPDKESHGWCDSKGDKQLIFREKFHILASFNDKNSPSYYIYVNETETLYGAGYFQLTFYMENLKRANAKSVFEPFEQNNIWNISSDKYQIISNHYLNTNLTNYLDINLFLTDVTDMFLTEERSKANEIISKELLTVCSIAPKIRVKCENFKTIRIRLCELETLRNGTMCSIRTKFCYSIDEYQFEYDNDSINFIRVCEKFVSKKRSNKTQVNFEVSQNNLIFLKDKFSLMVTLPGWVTMGSLIFSLIAMCATIFTYALFSELRNLPGWNIINLNLSLIIAQLTFLFGSFFNGWPLLCFIVSILTHFGFLASFFWMNVIAFDLHRNFRQKASHVLLQMIMIKDRLPYYAVYAWLSPFLIVLVCLSIDLSLKESKFVVPFRPCYADYLKGCEITNDYFNETTPLENRKLNESADLKDDSSCMVYHESSTIVFLNTACWIRNGRANLIFFGAPILIIIILNAIFFILTIYNIRKKKLKQKENEKVVRRFSRHKLPTDRDIKFYIRISSIMGFQWITGFFLVFFNFSYENMVHEILRQILIYLFILSGSSVGLFIFIAFICKREIKELYKRFFNVNLIQRFSHFSKEKPIRHQTTQSRQIPSITLSSVSDESLKTRSTNSSLVSTITSLKGSFDESFESIAVIKISNENNRSNDDDVFLDNQSKVKF